MFDGVKIIIPYGDGRLPLRVARCLGAVAARFVLLSNDRDNVARRSKYCSSFLYSNPQNDSELLDQLLRMEECSSPEIILPVTTDGFLFTSRNHEALLKRFHLPPVSTIDSLTLASDKWKLYEFSTDNEIPVLQSTLMSDIEMSAVESGESKLVFPALVKSRKREGGKGTRKIESAAELRDMPEKLGKDDAENYFVQRFVDGDDISLSAFL